MIENFLDNLNKLITIYFQINGEKPTILNVSNEMLNEISKLTHSHNLENKSGDKLVGEIFGLTIKIQDKKDFIFWVE